MEQPVNGKQRNFAATYQELQESYSIIKTHPVDRVHPRLHQICEKIHTQLNKTNLVSRNSASKNTVLKFLTLQHPEIPRRPQ